jgi:hypothetical protein
MIATQYFNAVLSFLLTGAVVFLLIRFNSVYNPAERIGHGVIGTSMFIAGFKQLGAATDHPWIALLILPWDPLYQSIWRVGLALMFGGKIWRLERHRRGNVNQNRVAAEYYAKLPRD